jgi:hypothetical protein
MKFPKNLGMLLLAIWLIITGIVVLAPKVAFEGLGTILAVLAIAAGVLLIMQK